MTREAEILTYFCKSGIGYDMVVLPPRLVRSSSSESSLDDSSSSSASHTPPPRTLFGSYWEKSKTIRQSSADMGTCITKPAENESIRSDSQIPQGEHVSATILTSERRQLFPVHYCTATDTVAQSSSSCSRSTLKTRSARNALSSSSGISTSMKTYPRSSFKVRMKRSRNQAISFNPDVHIVEFNKEQEEPTSSSSWLLWFLH
mmetsp:Transcript_23780/g.34082  ORF Transcript_23780/g.34082 Transcript_23780/m.34082 type:complete len:203 (+) Transcript_23780:55-663(+)